MNHSGISMTNLSEVRDKEGVYRRLSLSMGSVLRVLNRSAGKCYRMQIIKGNDECSNERTNG